MYDSLKNTVWSGNIIKSPQSFHLKAFYDLHFILLKIIPRNK